jgi:inosine/xanthosine triphosphate pyrophosphatase family protein
MKNLTFWTSNQHKLAETRVILWFEIQNRTVRAITWVSMFDWEKYTVWYWELEWRIPEKPRGDKFGWSNAFEVKWLDKTFWEITEK